MKRPITTAIHSPRHLFILLEIIFFVNDEFIVIRSGEMHGSMSYIIITYAEVIKDNTLFSDGKDLVVRNHNINIHSFVMHSRFQL